MRNFNIFPPYKTVKILINTYSINLAVFWVTPYVGFYVQLECILMQWTSLSTLANNGEMNIEACVCNMTAGTLRL